MIKPRFGGMNTRSHGKYVQTALKRRTGISLRAKLFGMFLVVLAAVLIGLHVSAGIVSNSMPEPSYKTVVVRQGDTLWDLARRTKPGTDPRKTVYEIRKLNQLESVNLQPGQILMIPSMAVCRN